MRRYGIIPIRPATLLAIPGVAMLGWAPLPATVAVAHAQPVEDYSLPPQQGSDRAPAQGPVDAENPVAGPTRAAPIRLPPPSGPETPTAPAPSALAPPTLAPPAPRSSETTDPARGRNRSPRAAPTAPAPLPGPAEAIATEASAAVPVLPSPVPPPVEGPIAESPAPRSDTGAPAWPLAIAGILLALGAIALLLRRRRAGASPEHSETPDIAPAPDDGSAPIPSTPVAAPRQPDAAATLDALVLALEPVRIGRTLLNATFAYRLTVTNSGERPVGPLRIVGDMAAAHASCPAATLLTVAETAPAIGTIPVLPPGASASLPGEVRLPFADIVPIRSGSAELLVPLARFRVEDAQSAVSVTRVFVIGEESLPAGTTVRPFRIDRLWSFAGPLGQREIAAAAGLGLDAPRAAR